MAENQYITPPKAKAEKKAKETKEPKEKKVSPKREYKTPEFLKDQRFHFSVGALLFFFFNRTSFCFHLSFLYRKSRFRCDL